MIDDLKLMIRPVGEKGFAVQASTLLGVKSEAHARAGKKKKRVGLPIRERWWGQKRAYPSHR